MGFNKETDAKRKAATRQKIVETGFKVFAERTIDAVNLTDIAVAAGLGMATVYRNFNSKTALVLEIGTWMWSEYYHECAQNLQKTGTTGAEEFALYLESFINLYRNHRDILRFNQFFNIYVQREGIPKEQMQPYNNVIDALVKRFHETYEKGKADGTLRTEESENEIFSKTIHLMLAAVTRYAVGLVYDGGIDPESELVFLKDMLLRAYVPDKQ